MAFSQKLEAWYNDNGRTLPWRGIDDPYRIWLSEIILQQTRIEQGRNYWLRFVEAFPTVADLAAASEEQVLRLWQGLGYYSRARNLHASARLIMQRGGQFPSTYDDILGLKGVGRYTANLSAKGMYWPLLNSTSLSQKYYDGRWTASNPDPNAKFPRLSSTSNANNYQTSTYWQRSRSFLKLRNVELYYNFPKTLMEKTGFMNTAKLYVRGIDLLCFGNVEDADPECYGVSAPLNKSVVVGVQLSF